MMVTQAVLYAGHILPVALLWLACISDIVPINRIAHDSSCLQHIILYAPIYAILLLGIYAVASVMYGVATFNDCPSAREELLQEIKEAQEDLRKRKII